MLTQLSSTFRKLPILGQVAAIVMPVLLVAALVLSLVGPYTPSLGSDKRDKALSGPLSAKGSKLVDAHGREVVLTGVNWFGFETETFAPHGLWARNWESMLDQMVSAGFNTIRLPYTNQMFDADSKPTGINYSLNPDLKGLRGVDLMDRIVKGATDRGLMVLLDRHRPTAEAQTKLWYNEQVTEDRWIKDWTMLAKRYKNNPLVIGADLHNEPSGEATWGSGDRDTDWRLAAERAGNAILKVNPNWLIVVEGIEAYKNNYYWWGGNLMGVKEHPVRLSDPSKLVYSAHDYGPGVWQQSWFSDKDFPKNMPGLWKRHWGYIAEEGTAPVLLGEFGGRSVSPKTTEGIWHRELLDYLKKHGISYTYWSWNPNSGDTGGVLRDDWKTIHKDKLELLKSYQAPRLHTPDADQPVE